MSTEREDYHVRSVKRALGIFDTFCNAGVKELGVGDIATRMKLPKATIHRILVTLVDAGYLEQNALNDKYRLGMRVFQLGYMVHNRAELCIEARPYLELLCEESQESVYLSTLVGEHRVCIDKVESPHAIRHISPLGESLPLHAGAAGKALLAFLPDERRNSIMEHMRLEKLSANTITNLETLRKELEEIRGRGYALSSDERFPGVSAIAAPIFGVTREILACLSVSGPTDRLDAPKRLRVVEKVQAYAAEISRRMGYMGPPNEIRIG